MAGTNGHSGYWVFLRRGLSFFIQNVCAPFSDRICIPGPGATGSPSEKLNTFSWPPPHPKFLALSKNCVAAQVDQSCSTGISGHWDFGWDLGWPTAHWARGTGILCREQIWGIFAVKCKGISPRVSNPTHASCFMLNPRWCSELSDGSKIIRLWDNFLG